MMIIVIDEWRMASFRNISIHFQKIERQRQNKDKINEEMLFSTEIFSDRNLLN